MTSSNESLVKDQLSSKCTNSAKDYFGSGNGGIYSDECQSGDAQWRKKQKKIHSKKLIVAQSLYNK